MKAMLLFKTNTEGKQRKRKRAEKGKKGENGARRRRQELRKKKCYNW